MSKGVDWASLENDSPRGGCRGNGMEAFGSPKPSPVDAGGGDADGDAQRYEVYVCDLEPALTELELHHLLGRYGEIVSLQRVGANGSCGDAAPEEAENGQQEATEATVLCGFSAREVADEAVDMLNHSRIRGRFIRCMLATDLEVIRSTLVGGRQRLFVEGLDAKIESRGLRDLAALFGDVLDSKVETPAQTSTASAEGAPEKESGHAATNVGFIHYAAEEEANKAMSILDGLQIGDFLLKVRLFEAKDVPHFTGCFYTVGCYEEAVAAGPPVPEHVKEKTEEAMAHFNALQYHYLEVLEDRGSKLQRLRGLVDSYTPNQDQQMIVVADANNMAEIRGAVLEFLEEADITSLLADSSQEEREAVVQQFDIGNIFVLVVEPALVGEKDFELGSSPAVVVYFDLPETFLEYVYGIMRRTNVDSRVHGFMNPSVDEVFMDPALSASEEAGHELEPKVLDLCMARTTAK